MLNNYCILKTYEINIEITVYYYYYYYTIIITIITVINKITIIRPTILDARKYKLVKNSSLSDDVYPLSYDNRLVCAKYILSDTDD